MFFMKPMRVSVNRRAAIECAPCVFAFRKGEPILPLSHSAIARATLSQMFAALDGVLEKGARHARAAKVEESVLLNWRLAPDMLPMRRQVEIACDIVSRGLARMAGAALPPTPEAGDTFAALRKRVAAARDFVAALDEAKIDADPGGEISFPVGAETMTLKRRAYLLNFVLPNLYFHVTTAYANLRACGVPLGKADFLARPR